MYLKLSGIRANELLAGTELQEKDLEVRESIAVRDHVVLMHNLSRYASTPAWAALLGSQLNINSHGALGFAALSAPTLGEALSVMADFHSTRLASFTAELAIKSGRIHIAIKVLEGDSLYQQWISESVLKILQSLVLTIAGHSENHKLSFHFAGPKPDYFLELQSIFGADCYFESGFTGMELPASWWAMPSPLHDEGSYRSNLSKCLERAALSSHSQNTLQQIESLLMQYFDQEMSCPDSSQVLPDLSYLAKKLCLSERTLIRRLARDGSSYKKVLGQLRMQYAESLLLQKSLSVADAGFTLGYSDPANFNRAFRKWFGSSPAVWRQQKAAR
ncbi:MAG: AraC family transcriptional regulator ligand-binding domain-containing protein [Endozoicomonas sp.]|uniref:AraC family transcriptional regulator n=1 Tax=Endozoicomonas sp. TaxID=1892382 RepID=UPI003D9BAB79